FVNWQFDNGSKPQFIIISQSTGDTTAPEYEGRLTLFRSTGSLELRDLKLSDSGEYTVTIQDGMNQPIGRTTLNVYEPVSNVNVSLLSSDLIEFNSSVSLFCSSSGSSLSFLWMKDGSEVTDSERVQINTNEENSNLTIVNVTRNDKGSYTCHVSNLVSSVISDPVKISVSYGPDNVQIEVYPSKEHHEKGSDINLTCSADSTPSAEYQWFLNGDKLTSSGPLLRLINIQMSQSGNYSCQAFNSKTLISQTSEPSPVSVHVNQSDLIEHRASGLINCSVSTGSSLSFRWMNGSSEVTAADRVQFTDGNSSLNIVSVSRYDSGPFRCEVFNPISNGTSDSVNFTLYFYTVSWFTLKNGPDHMRLTVNGLNITAFSAGSNLSMLCLAESNPPAQLQWGFRGNLVNATGTMLELFHVRADQSGPYSCLAFNNRTNLYSNVTTHITISSNQCFSSSSAVVGWILSVIFRQVVNKFLL
uniref:Ig-like domain-containing protein n=1 Tax=Xiphophorus couchianus TaxID=32473 RepID=A0A3B5MYX5_9TELE